MQKSLVRRIGWVRISAAMLALCVACSGGSESADDGADGGLESVLVRTGATVEA